MDSSESQYGFTIISLSIISGCIILGCCGYILSHRKYRKRHQVQSTNHSYAPEAQEQVFTIEMPPTQPSNNEQLSPYLSDKPSPSYENVETSVPTETQSNIPSITNNIDQMEQK